MRVTVGSKNQTKIVAVEEMVRKSELLEGATVVPVEVNVQTFGHPVGMTEVIEGAMNRARQAFVEADYSVGLEGGLLSVPHTKSGYMEITVCAIYDGLNFHLGLSPAFEWPKSVTDLIVHDGLDGSQAFKAAGFTDQEKIGTTKGSIWILTKGKIDRMEYNKLAVMMALIHLENKEHY